MLEAYRCTACGTFLEVEDTFSLLPELPPCPSCSCENSLIKHVSDTVKLRRHIKRLNAKVERQQLMINTLNHNLKELEKRYETLHTYIHAIDELLRAHIGLDEAEGITPTSSDVH